MTQIYRAEQLLRGPDRPAGTWEGEELRDKTALLAALGTWLEAALFRELGPNCEHNRERVEKQEFSARILLVERCSCPPAWTAPNEIRDILRGPSPADVARPALIAAALMNIPAIRVYRDGELDYMSSIEDILRLDLNTVPPALDLRYAYRMDMESEGTGTVTAVSLLAPDWRLHLSMTRTPADALYDEIELRCLEAGRWVLRLQRAD